jgi:hypothetical protein
LGSFLDAEFMGVELRSLIQSGVSHAFWQVILNHTNHIKLRAVAKIFCGTSQVESLIFGVSLIFSGEIFADRS